MLRYALLDADRAPRETVERYLPDNYRVVGTIAVPPGCELDVAYSASHLLVIAGADDCGWTLDDYVIPRLGSGLYFAEEVERIPVLLPHSEVCMHMRVAGRVAELTLKNGMAQIWLADNGDEPERFSAPVTLGEAGVMA